ncbi:MAG: Laminin sub domain 2, partial [Thermoleophilia bacterium]|nr:Laminin sub domain 2 [Thermoleophilia bacterium]
VKSVSGFDIAGNSVTDSFELIADTTPPSGGSLTVPSSIISTGGASISFVTGTDAQSNLASAQLQRRSGSYSNGTCETNYALWTSWGNVGPSAPGTASPIVDSPLTSGLCYEYQRVVTDNVGNVQTLNSTNQVKVDSAAPSGSFTVPAASATVGGSAVTVSGTANDLLSGVNRVEVTWTGPAATSGTVCLSPTLSPPPGVRTWTCSWNAAGLPQGPYTLTLKVYDNATPANTFTVPLSVTVDNDPPTLTFKDFQEVVGTGFSHPDPTPGSAKLYVNPATAGQVRVRFDAEDLGTGVASVAYPAIGGGWTPAGGAGTLGTLPTYAFVYDWANPVTGSGLKAVTATDNSGNASTANFEVELDSSGPVGGSIAVTDQTAKLPLGVPIGITSATDSQSKLGTVQIQRRQTNYLGNVCDPALWTIYGPVGPVNPGAAWTDTGISNATCYQYQVVFTDNVGNPSTVTSSSVVRIDRTLPTGSFTTPGANATISGVQLVSGNSSDVHGGVQNVDVTWTGPASSSGIVCNGASPTDPWSCPWTTPAVDGPYVLTLTVTDRAGNQFVTTRNVTVDNQPPSVAFTSFVEGTGAAFQQVDGTQLNKLWFNPAQAGNVTLNITASDGGSLMNRVDFPALGTGWTPATVSANNTPSGSVYSQIYTWTGGASSPGPRSAVGFDNAGNSASAGFEVVADPNPPTGGSITVPNVITSATTVAIPFTSSSDADSQVATGQFQRRSATYANGVCPDPAVTPAAWSIWGDVGASVLTTGTFTDPGPLTSGNCYEYRRLVTDRVGNVLTLGSTNQVKVDGGAPNGDFTAPLTGAQVSGNAVPVTGYSSDAISGVNHVDVSFAKVSGTGPASGSICANPPLTALPDPRNWTCSWDTTGMEGVFSLRLFIYDNASPANVTGPVIVTVTVDNQPPAFAWTSFSESINPGAMYSDPLGATPSKMYVNPALAGEFQVTFTGTDGGTGMQRADFPSAGTGWNPGGSHITTGPTFVYNYNWTSGATGTGLKVVSGFDNAGNSATANFEIEHDTTPPAGGSISYPGLPTNATSAAITLALASDSQSKLGTTQVERSSTDYANGTCTVANWTVFAPAGPGSTNPGTSWSDTNLNSATCYRYRVRFTDNVGNSALRTSSSELPIDRALPLGSITAPAVDGTAVSGTINIDGTSSDGLSGVKTVFIQAVNGADVRTVCTAVPTNPWSCPYDTTTLTQGTWTLRATITDNANNQLVLTRTVLVDNTPPAATFANFAEVSNGQYMYAKPATPSTLYVNPAFTGTFRVNVTSTDTGGTGMDQVDFPTPSAGFPATGWTGGGTDAVGPTTWRGDYTFTGPATPEPGTTFARSFDNAGNFTDVPFRVENDSTAPTSGSISPLNVTTKAANHSIVWVDGADAQSGIDTRQFQRRSTPFTGGACDPAWPLPGGTWTNVGSTSPANPFVDNSTSDQTCYQYRLVLTDYVGNSSTLTSANTFRVDRLAPLGTFDTPVATLWSGTQALSGTASDATSGVQSVALSYQGVGPAAAFSGTISCSGTTGWSCNWDTAALGAGSDGSYTITMLVTDNATNTYTFSRTVTIDN